MDNRVGTSLHTGVLITVLGLLAWVSGQPLLFPSLGPSAFVLAMWPGGDASDPRRVVGSHAVGVVAGLAGYHLLANGAAMTDAVGTLSLPGLRLALAGVLAIVLTVVGMLFLRIRHPPACATTLIVALGLLPTVVDGAVILLAVTVLVGVNRLLLASEHRLLPRGPPGAR